MTAHEQAGPEPSQAALVDTLAQLSFIVVNALMDVAGEYDATLTQVRLLGILRDRQPSMNALGRHLGLDKSSVSGLVDRAQRRGLVTRVASETDRRSWRVAITRHGTELAGRVSVAFASRIQTLTSGLTEPERHALSQVAAQIIAADARRHGIDLWSNPR